MRGSNAIARIVLAASTAMRMARLEAADAAAVAAARMALLGRERPGAADAAVDSAVAFPVRPASSARRSPTLLAAGDRRSLAGLRIDSTWDTTDFGAGNTPETYSTGKQTLETSKT